MQVKLTHTHTQPVHCNYTSPGEKRKLTVRWRQRQRQVPNKLQLQQQQQLLSLLMTRQ